MESACKARRLLQDLSIQNGAECAVLLFVHEHQISIGPAFARDTAPADALQMAINVAGTAWAAPRTRATLQRGRLMRLPAEALWPVMHDGEVVGLVYLSATCSDFPAQRHETTMERLVYHARRLMPKPPAYSMIEAALESVSLGLEEFRLLQIEALLARFSGNVSAVARKLGISRDTVYDRCRELGVQPRQFRPL